MDTFSVGSIVCSTLPYGAVKNCKICGVKIAQTIVVTNHATNDLVKRLRSSPRCSVYGILLSRLMCGVAPPYRGCRQRRTERRTEGRAQHWPLDWRAWKVDRLA